MVSAFRSKETLNLMCQRYFLVAREELRWESYSVSQAILKLILRSKVTPNS